MHTNENLGQAKPVVRLPEMNKASHPMLETRWKRPDATPRAVAAKQPDVNRHPRRFGAGF